jgi:hypothetical protein
MKKFSQADWKELGTTVGLFVLSGVILVIGIALLVGKIRSWFS